VKVGDVVVWTDEHGYEIHARITEFRETEIRAQELGTGFEYHVDPRDLTNGHLRLDEDTSSV
jgi:hypothetical protein